MSGTTSTISILKLDKTIKTSSTNYDGNPSHTGKILNISYIDTKSVDYLISQGNISGLHAAENLSNKQSALIFSTKKEYLENVQHYNFNYLFKEEDQNWYLVKGNKLQKLAEILADSKENAKNLTTKKRLK